MKKSFLYVLIFMVLVFCWQGFSWASGLTCEGLGTKAISMGGAFIGLADDSSAIYWNPAGLARLKGSEVAFGAYTMHSFMRDSNSVSNLDTEDRNPSHGDYFPRIYPTEPTRFDKEEDFWPFCAAMPAITAYKTFDNFTLGGGAYLTAGAYSNWSDTIRDPVTSAKIHASLWSMMMIMDFNISIATKLTDQISLGLGLDLIYGRLKGDLDKEYLGSNEPTQPDYKFRMETEADGMGFQGIIGLLYEISPKLSVGGIFRTGTNFDMQGDTSSSMDFYGVGGAAEKSDHYNRFRFAPSGGIGIAYRPTHRLILTADWQRSDWTKYMWPFGDMHYDDEGSLLQDTIIDPGWFASSAYKFGFEYRWNERLALRGGYWWEKSGIPHEGEGFETTNIGDPIRFANLGFGYQWDVWNLDFMAGTMWGSTPAGTRHR